MSILYKNARNVRFVLFRKNSNVLAKWHNCVMENVTANMINAAQINTLSQLIVAYLHKFVQ